MAEAIAPMVHGERSGWRRAAAFHVAASTGAGSVAGFVAGAVGAALAALGAPVAVLAVAFALVALAGAGREALAPRLGLPGRRAQVPRDWGEQLPAPAAALLYGAGLGVGFATHVTSAAYWAAVAGAVATAHAGWGALVGATFGLFRAGTVVAVTRSLTDWEGARERLKRFDRAEQAQRRGVAALLTAVAVVVLTLT